MNWCQTSYDCLEAADALIVCTEWREFRSPDFTKIKSLMNGNKVFDGRLLYQRSVLEKYGLDYVTIGRP